MTWKRPLKTRRKMKERKISSLLDMSLGATLAAVLVAIIGAFLADKAIVIVGVVLAVVFGVANIALDIVELGR